MKLQNIFLVAALGGTGYLVWNNYEKEQHRAALSKWIDSSDTDTQGMKDQFKSVLNQMSGSELNATYDMVFNYLQKNILIPPGSALQAQLLAISEKYHIFT